MSRRLAGGLTALVAVLTLPVGLLSKLFVGLETGLAVFIVGWFLLTPLVLWSGLKSQPASGANLVTTPTARRPTPKTPCRN